MIVEHFREGNPVPVYERFHTRGRLTPDGVLYVASWVAADLTRCFQIMECADRALLDQWMANWADLVEFEVAPVLTSEAASAAVQRAARARP